LKRIVSISLLLVLLLPGIYKCGVLLYYQLNKEYIASSLCVNIDRPITMCYGKCFLERSFQLVDHAPESSTSISQLKYDISDFLYDEIDFSVTPRGPFVEFTPVQLTGLSEGIPSFIFRPPLA